jgi:hypothetical protein
MAVHKLLCSLISVLLCSISTYGQTDQNAIESSTLTLFPSPSFYLDVHFSNRLSSPEVDLVKGNVILTTVPADLNPELAISTISLLPGSRKGIRISFSSELPHPEPTSVAICFAHIGFIQADGTSKFVDDLCASVQLLDPTNVVAQKALLLKGLQVVPKTQAEKNIFASGFVTSASSGTAGGLDLDLNSNQLGIPGLTVFLRTNKTSLAGGDPKNLEIGTNFRGTYLFGQANYIRWRNDISKLSRKPDDASAAKDINDTEKAVRAKLLSAVVVDVAGKLEGEATSFDVSNYVADLQGAVQSRTKTLLGSRKGFWEFRFLPVGLETGKNVQNTPALATDNGSPVSPGPADTIARYKGGGELHLFYDDPENVLPLKRIALTLMTAQRFLFTREAISTSAESPTTYSRGARPWYEADLLVYLAESAHGRYGFKLTYNNGSLPPAFATAKSFNFGFVYESNDGEQK